MAAGFSGGSGGGIWAHPTLNYCISDAEKLIQCPYEKSHIILETRFMRHLIKCRENYAKNCTKKGITVQKKVCKYTASHHIPLPEIELHEQTCPDRISIVEFQRSTQQPGWQLPGIVTREREDDEYDEYVELWTEDEKKSDANKGQPGYDPHAKLATQALPFVPQNLTKSERRNFYEMQRKRFSRFEAQQSGATGGAGYNDNKDDVPGATATASSNPYKKE